MQSFRLSDQNVEASWLDVLPSRHESDVFSAGAMVARKTSTVNYSRDLEALGSSPRWRVSGLNPQALSRHLFLFLGVEWL